MNLITHQLYLYTPTGELLTIIPDGSFSELTYGFRELEAGVLEFTLPGDFDLSLLMIDGLVEVYRSYSGVNLGLEGDTAFFIRHPIVKDDEKGVRTIYVKAFSAFELLKRRIVAYYAGSSYSEKLRMPWDDMMREFMYENYGPGASYAGASYVDPYYSGDAERNLEPWLEIEPDYHWGASYDKSAPWQNIADCLTEIAEDVRSNGQYCSFDIVRTSPGHFEFRVFLGPRGIDHSADAALPVIVSQERKNLLAPALDFDWEDEFNFVYGTGQGLEDNRILQTAQDITRIGISPFNRREYNQDARQAKTEATVLAEANAALEEHRPKRIFTGSISQTPGCIYGVHWKWGDIVTAEYKGLSIDCHVDAVVVSIDANGTEVVTGALRSVSDVG